MIFHENEKDMPTRPFFDPLPCFLLGSSFLKTPAACIMNQLDDLPENKEDSWLVISKILQLPTTNYQEPQTTIYKWMFSETTIFYIKIWNHPIETTIYKWLALGFQVVIIHSPPQFFGGQIFPSSFCQVRMYSSRGMSLADVEWLPEEFGVEKNKLPLFP